MEGLSLAYCAGVIDSDGCITIKRRKTSTGHTYAPVVFVRQVEPQAVELLASLFGGRIRVHGPSLPGGRDLNHWEISHRKAIAATKALLPYLRIKRRQAELAIEYGTYMENPRLRVQAEWFRLSDSDTFYTPQEAADLKDVARQLVYQAISNKSVFSVKRGSNRLIPRRFWDAYEWGSQGRKRLATEYVALRERMVAEIRCLNGPTRGIRTADRLARRNEVHLASAG